MTEKQRLANISETHFYHISEKGKMVNASSLEEAQELAKAGGYIWLSYIHPSLEDLTPLIEKMGLHHLSIEDCLNEGQIPKIEDFPNHTYILFNAFNYTKKKIVIEEVNLFIGENFLITVNHKGPTGRILMKSIEEMVIRNIEKAELGPAFLMHLILDHIVDEKFIAVEALEEDLNIAEEKMLQDLEKFDLSNLQHIRRNLLTIRKSLFHEREILLKICRKDCPYISDQAIFHYRDIYDHLARFFELTETYREIVTSLMEMHLSLLNNKMAKSANKTNATVRRLTFITTIFMPLTLLSGIGGMSEYSMMTGSENWKISYPIFMVAMGILGYMSLRWLKRLEKNEKDEEEE
jgi:magnesium transporter